MRSPRAPGSRGGADAEAPPATGPAALRPAQIADVAREVGVSTATVSRALRGLPRVSPRTRARVLEAAARLDYVASPSAASLASGRTHAVGVIVPHVSEWFFGAVIQGAEELLRAGGYDLLLYNLGGSDQARRRVFSRHLLHRRVDAVLVLALTPREEEVRVLTELGRPVVLVGGSVPGWGSVGIDDRDAARLAMRHLLELGHKRIGYIGGYLEAQLDFTAPRDRLVGYREGLAAAGLPHDPELEIAADFTLAGGAAALRGLLDRCQDCPTAIFAASDVMAMGAIYAARRAGLRVPEDLSVIGIDDHEMAEIMDLTTVAQPVYEQGRIAARLLLDALNAEATGSRDAGRPQPTLTVPTSLVVRGTTAPPVLSRRRRLAPTPVSGTSGG